ncbi:hypothetical protein QQ045_028412 [Rhodiola kirilowii]
MAQSRPSATTKTATPQGLDFAMPTPIKTRNKVIKTPVVGEEDGQPLSPVSQMFHKPDSNSYILAIFGFKTLIDVDHFREQMVGFARGHRRFHSLQVGKKERQKLKWVRTEVDICKHVIAPDIAQAEMISSGEKFLEDYLHNLSKTGIDMSKPLWEFHILNGVETSSDVKSVGIGRIHHSLGDGTSLMLYFLTFARKSLSGTAITAATLIPVTKKMSGDEENKSLKRKIKRVWNLAKNTSVDVLATLATPAFLKDSKNPVSAPADTGRAPRRIVQRTVSLDDVKLIKKATNTKVNDILMAVLEAGLSRYLSRRYGEVNKCKGQKSDAAPPDIRLRTLVTFNLRMPQSTSQIGSVKKSGNRVGFILYPLRVPMRSNPMDYIHAAKAKMDRKKASLEAHFTNLCTRVVVKLFGTKLLELPKNVSLYYSNMIGPLEDITWFGYPVESMAISSYGSPIGLYVNVTSYGNKLTFALSVDERAVPDPHQLCDDLDDSLSLIKNAATATVPDPP